MDLEELELTWRWLEDRPIEPDVVRVRQPPEAVPGFEVLFGLDDSGCRHLLIPIRGDAPLDEDRRSAGVQVVEHRLAEAGEVRRFVDLACRLPHLHELFTVIALDLLESLDQGQRPDVVARQVLEAWRELLDRPVAAIPGTAALTGVFGELWWLREIVRRDPSLTGAWVGPLKRRHDIVTATGAIEVKTTQARSGWRVEIHGLDQLEEPEAGGLYIAAMRIEAHPSEGETLSGLVDAIVESGGSREQLRQLLDRVGISSETLRSLEAIRFSVRESRMFEVSDAFPRLTRSSVEGGVPEAIVDANYLLDLALIDCEPVPADRIGTVLDIVAGVARE